MPPFTPLLPSQTPFKDASTLYVSVLALLPIYLLVQLNRLQQCAPPPPVISTCRGPFTPCLPSQTPFTDPSTSYVSVLALSPIYLLVPNTPTHSQAKLPVFIAYVLHRTKLHPSVTFAALVLLQHLKAQFQTNCQGRVRSKYRESFSCHLMAAIRHHVVRN